MFCLKCGFAVESKKILKHWRDFHEDDSDYSVVCPECSDVYKTKSTFQKHWYSKHHRDDRKAVPSCAKRSRDEGPSSDFESGSSMEPAKQGGVEEIHQDIGLAMGASIADEPIPPQASASGLTTPGEQEDVPSVGELGDNGADCANESDASDSDEGDSDASDSDDNAGQSDGDSDSEGVPLQQMLQSLGTTKCTTEPAEVNPAAASFIMNLRDKGATQAKQVQAMLKSTECVVESALKEFSVKVQQKLQEKGVTLDEIMNIDKAVLESSNVFQNLQSTKKQDKYFQREFHYVKPVCVPLGRELTKRKFKGKSGRKLTAVGEELVYVPLKKTIDKLVNHPDFENFVEEGKMNAKNSHFLDSYMKGEKSKRNPVLKDHPDALRFVLYYDDLEACSPLKSKSGLHKIGAFYLYVDNIPLKYRSRLSNIMLLALVNAKFLSGKSYGVDHAIQSLVNSLKEFEGGVVLPSGKRVFGTLIAVIGDNKGLHALGGFKEGFTAHRPCRFCSAILSQVQTMSKERKELLRDIDSYTEQCNKVQTVKGKNEKLSTEYGLNRDSVLNTLESYHVVEGLPPDAMHDVLEGSLSLTIKKMLRQYLYKAKQKPFTLDWLNAAIESFDYGYSESSSKPSPLKKELIDTNDNSTKLHQSASQLWTLATILPLIIGPLVDENDKFYENFLDILEITRIVFSTDIPAWMVDYLDDLIESYLLDYMSLYGDLIPKQHHLVHYPTMIRLMGSLLPYMCMRMEAKHKYFKKLVETLGCFRNIYKSLALKHQINISVEWSKSLKSTNKSGPCKKVYPQDTVYQHLLPSNVTELVEANWLLFEGNKFTPNECFLHTGFAADSLPVFVKVKTVIIHPVIVFICQKTVTMKRNVHLAAYEIQILEELCTSNPKDMVYHSILHAHTVSGKLYVSVKYCAGGELM